MDWNENEVDEPRGGTSAARRPRIIVSLACLWLLAAPVAARPLGILTYNAGLLRILGIDVVPLVERRAALLPAALAVLAEEDGIDVILLEEIWRDRDAAAIEAALAPLGFDAARPRVKGLVGSGGGLVLLVRSPLEIADWLFAPFDANGLYGMLAPTGIIRARITDARDGIDFMFFGTHMPALDTKGGSPYKPAQIKAFESDTLRVFTEMEAGTGNGATPSLLGGDFNAGRGYAEIEYRNLSDMAGMIDAAEAFLGPTAPVTWDPSNPLVAYGLFGKEPPAAVDHIFVRDGSEREWKVIDSRIALDEAVGELVLNHSGRRLPPVASPLSDHYALFVRAELSSERR
jgi:endonuclease/exonuclease/phosphatase family metal-dependent hydrolase